MKDCIFGNYRIPERMMEGINLYIHQRIKPGDFLTAVIQNDLQGAVFSADRENLANLPAYAGYFFSQAPSRSYGSPEIMKDWLAEFSKKGASACTHDQVRPNYEYVTCKACGKIKTGNHSDTWGVAKDKWFTSLAAASFYKKHGKLPEFTDGLNIRR